MFKPKTTISGRLENSSGAQWIRTEDLRVMSQNPESVPFVRRALQISRPDELWSTLAGHASVVNRCSYSICFTWVRQVLIFICKYNLPKLLRTKLQSSGQYVLPNCLITPISN